MRAARVVASERLRYGDLEVAAARDVYILRLRREIIAVAAFGTPVHVISALALAPERSISDPPEHSMDAVSHVADILA